MPLFSPFFNHNAPPSVPEAVNGRRQASAAVDEVGAGKAVHAHDGRAAQKSAEFRPLARFLSYNFV